MIILNLFDGSSSCAAIAGVWETWDA